MAGDSVDRGVSRRDFNIATAAGAAGLALVIGLNKAGAAETPAGGAAAPAGPTPKGDKIPLRDLGKTGLKVTEISLGAMDVADPAVVEKAIDNGINYIDTAHSYQGGRNEEMLGKIMPRRRNEVLIATKWNEDSKEGYMKSLETSLKRMQTDHVDFIQFHGANNKSAVQNEALRAAFEDAKKQGKARFFGITTDSNQAEVIQSCIDAGYVDQMLIVYNAATDDLSPLMKKAREAGIATVIMKSLQGAGKFRGAGDSMTPHQMAVRWVLDKPFVDSVCIGMTSFAQVDEDLKASHLKMTAIDKVQFERFAAALAASACARCGACRGCKRGVEPDQIVRTHMYAYDYGDFDKARTAFLEIGGPKMLAACVGCGDCERACPRKLDIRKRFEEVASLIG